MLSTEPSNYHTCKNSCRPSLSRAASARSTGNKNCIIYRYCSVENRKPRSTANLRSTGSVDSTGGILVLPACKTCEGVMQYKYIHTYKLGSRKSWYSTMFGIVMSWCIVGGTLSKKKYKFNTIDFRKDKFGIILKGIICSLLVRVL